MQAVAVFQGAIQGFIEFHDAPQNDQMGCLVSIQLQGFLPFSIHAIHIHEKGDTRQGCASLGPHYNPHHRAHGSCYLHGNDRHAGDLINNIWSNKRGSVDTMFWDPLFQVRDIVGRSIVIHAKPDDYGIARDWDPESQQTGNAGQRIGCAIIGYA